MSNGTELLDSNAIYSLDTDGMFEHIRTVGPQFLEAWARSEALSLPPSRRDVTAVVVAGIGGSATAGDYFAAVTAPVSPVPVLVVQGYDLPAWIGPQTLVVACSYSGNTPETLSAYEIAHASGAQLAVVTSGGTLAAKAATDLVPVFPIEYRASPRATTVHTLAPLLRIGEHLGIVSSPQPGIEAAARAHSELVETQLAPAVLRSQNPAKELAHALHGRTAIILGAAHLEPAAVRFKNQLAENGKVIAVADFVPQAGHNLVVGLATAAKRPGAFAVVALGSRLLSRAVAERALAVVSEFESAGVPGHGILVEGSAILADLLLATAWGDYVSCYVALLNGQDPTPVPQIDRVRAYGS